MRRPPTDTTALPSLKEFHPTAVSVAEKQYLQDLIAAVAGNIDNACRISGLSRSRLYTLLRKHQLSTKLIPQASKP